jgi:hypothetical protein
MALPKEQLNRIDQLSKEGSKEYEKTLIMHIGRLASKSNVAIWRTGFVIGATAEAERAQKLVDGLNQAREHLTKSHAAAIIIDKALNEYNNAEIKQP